MQTAPATFVDFANATFRILTERVEQTPSPPALLDSLVYRPALFRRNEVRWIAAYAWRARSKARGIAALKHAKKGLDLSVIDSAAAAIATLIREVFGDRAVKAITNIPCGHSRRPDCFGKRLAQSVASKIDLPFLQIFADRPRAGTSHPKQSADLPPLRQIADAPKSLIIIDDLATSGWHVEEAVRALRRLGAAASSFVWISGAVGGGSPLITGSGKVATDDWYGAPRRVHAPPSRAAMGEQPNW